MSLSGKYTISFKAGADINYVFTQAAYGLCGTLNSGSAIDFTFNKVENISGVYHILDTGNSANVVDTGDHGLVLSQSPAMLMYLSNLVEKPGGSYTCNLLMWNNPLGEFYSVSNNGTYGLYGTPLKAADAMVFTLTPVS